MHDLEPDDRWDFRDANTRTLTNCFHRYPAMMVPQVIDQLLQEFGRPGMSLLDPFCGTGRALVAGRSAGLQCIGIDINPLAVLVARTKLQELDPAYLNERYRRILDRLDRQRRRRVTPQLIGLDAKYWFSASTRAVLTDILYAVRSEFSRECAAKDFFYVALSETIRDSSWTRKAEFKLYRMSEAELERFKPNPVALFEAKVRRNIEGMRAYLSALPDPLPSSMVVLGDARAVRSDKHLASRLAKGVDLIVTSPPYGDARTTVDYGNFSRLSLAWLATDVDFAGKWGLTKELITGINRRCLGGDKSHSGLSVSKSPKLAATTRSIAVMDDNRADDVICFFDDLHACLASLSEVLRPTGHLCLIVANRTVKGIEVPTNEIVIELAQTCGLTHSTTNSRRIIGKRLPSRINTNSTTINSTATMTSEYIITFRSDRTTSRMAA